jgi:3-methyladenine DNA glycosylase AlkD
MPGIRRIPVMKLNEALQKLKSLGDEKVRAFNVRNGAGDDQFGVKLGDVRALAKKIGTDPELALALWKTGNLDARLLAILLMEPKRLAADDLDRMVRSVRCMQDAEWLTSYVVKKHPEKESLRQKWMSDDDPKAARAGWSLTAERVAKDADGLDLVALLDRIESELGAVDPMEQWTMNCALAGIGIHHPAHRERAVAIGERLGVYRDYPVSRGCTSPFAPIWIGEMVRRDGSTARSHGV